MAEPLFRPQTLLGQSFKRFAPETPAMVICTRDVVATALQLRPVLIFSADAEVGTGTYELKAFLKRRKLIRLI